jgi:hypothetical protein
MVVIEGGPFLPVDVSVTCEGVAPVYERTRDGRRVRLCFSWNVVDRVGWPELPLFIVEAVRRGGVR